MILARYGHPPIMICFLIIDQNEKLIAFGVTHVCAVDGFSGKIVGFISMPVKSNYDKLYR